MAYQVGIGASAAKLTGELARAFKLNRPIKAIDLRVAVNEVVTAKVEFFATLDEVKELAEVMKRHNDAVEATPPDWSDSR